MKALFKLSGQRRPAVIVGLALAVFLPVNLPVTAQEIPLLQSALMSAAATSTNTTTTTNAPNATTTTNAPKTVDQAPSPTDYTNWVTLGAGGSFVSGDKAQFQQQQDTKDGVFGGVQDFHWQQFVGKTGTLTVDGHAMAGNHDYDFHLDYTDPTLGYIHAGYTEYRTWYDGNGGFFPTNDKSFSLYDNDLYIDRRSAWIEGGLTLPDWPILSLRYEYDSREGQMPSTSWGDDGTAAPDVKIVPTYLGIDETRNIFLGNVKDSVDGTDFGLSLRYELDDTKDSTYIDLDPLNAPGTAGNRFVTDYDIEKNDLFNANGFTKTLFNDKVTFTSGFSYENVDTNLGGSRVYGPAYNYPLSNFAGGAGYTSLAGGGNTTEYIENMNLMLTPVKNLVLVPAFRFEYDNGDLDENNVLTDTASSTTTPASATSVTWDSSVAESLEARYTGLRDGSLYASAEWSQDWGNDDWNETTAIITPILNQNWNRFCQKYTLGANWYPLSQLNFGAQYYHQEHDYDFAREQGMPSVATDYPGYLDRQNFTTDDMNIRATWMALNNLTLVTRYDFQYATVDTWSLPDAGVAVGGVQSSNLTNQIISENINWTPLTCLYLQVGGSYVINDLDTPVGSIAGINDALVPNSVNDYWTINASAGYAINAKTNLQLQYFFYNANDYLNNSAVGVPYGAGDKEQSITATLTRQISKAVQVSLKYGYYTNRDATSGGQDNYNAQMVYVSTRFGF